jgi:hypothetical protein
MSCGTLPDCFDTLAIAVAVAAFLSVLVAFVVSGGGAAMFALAGGRAWGAGAAAATWTNAAAAATAAAAAGTTSATTSGGTPGNNQAGSRQLRDALREGERAIGRRLTKDEVRRLHDEIAGRHLGHHEIVDVSITMFGG